MLLYHLVVPLWLLARSTRADAPETFFINPPPPSTGSLYIDDPVLSLGAQYTVNWSTNLTAYEIFLWQQHLDADSADVDDRPVYSVFSGQPGLASFDWTVGPGEFDLDTSPVFFFTIGFEASLTDSFTCHYFNITNEAAAAATTSTTSAPSAASTTSTNSASSTSSTSIETPTSATSPTAVTASLAAPLPTNTANPTPPKHDESLAIGLGVGLGLVALLAAYLGYKHFKKSGAKSPIQLTGMDMAHSDGVKYSDLADPPTWVPSAAQGSYLYEMDSGPEHHSRASQIALAELPAQPSRT